MSMSDHIYKNLSSLQYNTAVTIAVYVLNSRLDYRNYLVPNLLPVSLVVFSLFSMIYMLCTVRAVTRTFSYISAVFISLLSIKLNEHVLTC
jgi:hypothetical protein